MLRLPFLVRCPGTVPQGRESDAIQSLVDLAPTFLDAAHVPIPRDMQGVSQLSVWRGEAESARNCAMTEFRHQPTKLQLWTFIDEQWKMTIYRNEAYCEMFDLANDPDERRNLWSEPAYATERAMLMHRFLNAEMAREPMVSPQIAGA
jgi:uncharacterized sulfatase